MAKLCIFGAGAIGQEAYTCLSKDNEIVCFIDNNQKVQGKYVCDIPIISLEDWNNKNEAIEIIIACGFIYQLEIEKQLIEAGIKNYSFYNRTKYINKKRLVSYCMQSELEDVILYHLFKDEEKIFYIDVGSNDPFAGSVTKLLYDMKSAHGINIEPQKDMYYATCLERIRDINLNIGLGKEERIGTMYVQSGCSTLIKENVLSEQIESQEITIRTLANVCKENIKEDDKITFLKIDVEGFEKEVLLGADFVTYRPSLVMIESTIPNSTISNYQAWEYILTEKDYKFVYQRGVNRYYVESNNIELIERFKDIGNIEEIYDIWYAKIQK